MSTKSILASLALLGLSSAQGVPAQARSANFTLTVKSSENLGKPYEGYSILINATAYAPPPQQLLIARPPMSDVVQPIVGYVLGDHVDAVSNPDLTAYFFSDYNHPVYTTSVSNTTDPARVELIQSGFATQPHWTLSTAQTPNTLSYDAGGAKLLACQSNLTPPAYYGYQLKYGSKGESAHDSCDYVDLLVTYQKE